MEIALHKKKAVLTRAQKILVAYCPICTKFPVVCEKCIRAPLASEEILCYGKKHFHKKCLQKVIKK